MPGHPDARRALLLLARSETAEEAAEARRLGGLHRRKKKTVAAIYGVGGPRTIDDLQGILETAAIETMALENSISRNRAIAGMVAIGAKLLKTGELAERIPALELATGPGRPGEPSDGSLLGG